VVLVCEHNAEGAFGLILNRPSENRLGDVLQPVLPELLHEAKLFGGGPVQPAALSYLYSHPTLIRGNVMRRLSLGHDLPALLALAVDPPKGLQIRAFAGYAGWAPGQLEDELSRESWITREADAALVFHEPAEDLWRWVLRRSPEWTHRLLGDSPDHLSAN
jgi:putative transcriptional regulator